MIEMQDISDLINYDECLPVVREGVRTGEDINYVDGKPVKRDPKIFAIVCNVQPLSGKELKLVPEGDRSRKSLNVYAWADPIPLKVNDKVFRGGTGYQVQSTQDWGTFVAAVLIEIDVGEELRGHFARGELEVTAPRPVLRRNPRFVGGSGGSSSGGGGGGGTGAQFSAVLADGLVVGMCVAIDENFSTDSMVAVKQAPLQGLGLSPAVGVVVSINGSVGLIQSLGTVSGAYQNLSIGSPYFVGNNGFPVTLPVPPVSPSYVLQRIGVAVGLTTLMVLPQTPLARLLA